MVKQKVLVEMSKNLVPYAPVIFPCIRQSGQVRGTYPSHTITAINPYLQKRIFRWGLFKGGLFGGGGYWRVYGIVFYF